MIFAGTDLARRLEALEMGVSASFARAASGSVAMLEAGGGLAICSGNDSPINAVKGLGVRAPVAATDVERIEAFFREHGVSTVVVDVCPLGDESLPKLLGERGYGLAAFETVLWRPVAPEDAHATTETPADVRIDVVGRVDIDEWALVMARGFTGLDDPPATHVDLGRMILSTPGAIALAARHEGRIVAGAGMSLHDGAAALYGTATIPAFRGRGIQTALLRDRLRRAADAGRDLAKIDTRPGTTSQRNAERLGFRVAYTRAQVTRTLA